MTPEELIDATSAEVINRLMNNQASDFEKLLVQGIANLSEPDQYRLAPVLANAIFTDNRGRQQTLQKRSYGGTYTRVLQDGSPVTTNSAGTTVDLTNHSLGDTLNFLEADVKINANRRQFDIRARGGAGTDCEWDIIVSTCWADEVAAGRGTEGQEFTSLTGCTFVVFSTLTLMQNHIEDGVAGTTWVVLICPGTYNEKWTIDSTGDPMSGGRIRYHGGGAAKTIVAGNGTTSLEFAGNGGWFANTNVGGLFEGLRFSDQTLFPVNGSSMSVYFQNCYFENTVLQNGCTVDDVHFSNCDIVGSLSTSTTGTFSTITYEHCYLNGNLVTDTLMAVGPIRVTDCLITGGIDFMGTGGDARDIIISQNRFLGGTINGGANVVRVGHPAGLSIVGNTFRSAGTGATILLYETAGRRSNVSITGNTYATANTNGYVGTAGGAEIRNLVWNGDTFNSDGGAAVKATATTCILSYSTLGPNAPDCMDYSSVTSTSGMSTNVFYTSCTVPSGATRPLYSTSSSTGAPAGEAFVTIGNTANLSAERALTAGNGVGFDDGGANSTATLKLVPLTALYDQSGAFNWVNRGGDLIIANSKDVKGYSDNSTTPSSQTFDIDGAAGNIAGAGQAHHGVGTLGDFNVTVDGSTLTNQLVVRTNTATRFPLGLVKASSTSPTIFGADLGLFRARGTYASPTVVGSTDQLGAIVFYAHDGTDFNPAASIIATMDGTPGADDVPGSLHFYTTPDGSKIPVERMSIANTGLISFGGGLTTTHTAKTIASDQIAIATADTAFYTLAGEGAAADDLDGITGGTQGRILILSAVSDTVTITVKHNNAGGSSGAKIFTASGSDVTLDDIHDTIMLIYKPSLDSGAGGWMQVGGGAGGSGDVATDAIWDAAGDLAVGTGANTAARLAIGTLGKQLQSDGSTAVWTRELFLHQWYPCTTAGCEPPRRVEAGTNDIDQWVLAFDATSAEGAFANVIAPCSFTTCTAQFFWRPRNDGTNAFSSGTCIWGIQVLCLTDDDAVDTAYPTATTVSDTFIATTDLHISAASGAHTPAGTPTAGKLLNIRVTRDISDTGNGDAWLIGVKLVFS